MIDHLLEISKLPATDISLDEVKSATEDHDQYVESLGKKASSIQLNLDRCKTLMQSSDNWTKDRIEAKKSKLDALRAAKARLEATACFLSYQGHEARSQANTTSYYRATPTSKNSKELLRDIHLALSNWFLVNLMMEHRPTMTNVLTSQRLSQTIISSASFWTSCKLWG